MKTHKPHKPHSEILFQAFDAAAPRFRYRLYDAVMESYIDGFLLDGKGNLCSFENGKLLRLVDFERIIIEQCTGFRDKTGELIYEGDVVLLDTGREKLVHAVKWFQGKFVLINKKGVVDGLVWSVDNRSVIGNIHEPKWGIESEVKE